jgi:colanic acid biosynthesis protein WcaH
VDAGRDDGGPCLAAPDAALIEPRLYRKIASRVPILCVDLVIRNIHGKVLLLKRKNHPLKGQWWVVGGRVNLGEDPLAAVLRKAKEETGLDVTIRRMVGYYSEVYSRNRFAAGEYHTVSLVFECVAWSDSVTLDAQSSAHKWGDVPDRFAKKMNCWG